MPKKEKHVKNKPYLSQTLQLDPTKRFIFSQAIEL